MNESLQTGTLAYLIFLLVVLLSVAKKKFRENPMKAPDDGEE